MIRIVVAADLNNAIGKGGKLPWRLKDDLRMFRQITMGGTVVMGRITYQSIGRALPGRSNIVLSLDPYFDAPDSEVARSIHEIMVLHNGSNEVLNIIGGASVYNKFWNKADEICLTRVNTRIDGADVFIPAIDTSLYDCIKRVSHGIDEDNEYSFEFQIYRRKKR